MVSHGEDPDPGRVSGGALGGILVGIGLGLLSLLVSLLLASVFPPLALLVFLATGFGAFFVLFGSQDQGRSRAGCGVLVAYLLAFAAGLLWISGFD